MTWQLAIAVSITANVAAILIQRRYSQRSLVPSTFPPAISYLFGVLPVGITAGLFVFAHDIRWSLWVVLLLLIEGVAMAISGATGFYVARKLTVTSQLTIYRFCGVVVIILGWTILGEKLGLNQLLGAMLLLAASWLAIWAPIRAQQKDKTHTTDLSYLILALVSATALGIALVTEKALLGHMEVGGVFLVGWVAQTIGMSLLALKDASKETIRKITKHEFKWSVVMGLTNGLTGVFYVYSLATSDNISLITALTSLVMPLSVFGAYVFLREREKQLILWISLFVAFLGVMILSL
jgi:uncharacterized membrane protein